MRHISLQSVGLAVLIAVFIPISIIAYQIESRLFTQQIEESQQKTKLETETAFSSFIQQQFRLFVVLAEEIVFLREIDALDYEVASAELQSVLPKLQFSYPVSDIRLVNPERQTTLATGKTSLVDTNAMYFRLKQTESPIFDIFCLSDCYMSVAIPIQLQGAQWAFIITVELDETLVSFSLLRNINLALLTTHKTDTVANRQWQNYNMPILTNSKKMQPIFESLTHENSEDLASGLQTVHKKNDYFVWKHRYKASQNSGLDLVFIKNTSALRKEQRDRFTFEVIFILVLLSAIIISIAIFISGPVSRLQKLEFIVRKTGKKEYSQAINLLEKNTTKTLFTDEISTVQNALLQTTVNLKNYEKELKNSNSHLEHVALYDSITALKNRYAFSTDFERISADTTGIKTTLVLIDIFGLTSLNNNLGHDVGDMVLQEVAKKLSPFVNESRQVYRFGGDEFIICCTNYKSQAQTIVIVEEILQKFDESIQFDKLLLSINVNIGIATADSTDKNFSKLISQTAIALNEAKTNNDKPYQFFTPEMEANSELLFRIKSDFASSLVNNEFSLNYQPMLNFWSGKVVKMEALVRWHHHDIGPIYPDKFIPILEETGQIAPLTDWILDRALDMVSVLDSMDLHDVVISVNISGRQVTDLRFIDKIAEKLENTQVDSSRIELEITETSLVSNFEIAKEWVEKAQAFGFKVAMDDFGTGYSSLSYLTSIAFDTIKLDKSLINYIATEEKHQNVVTSMVNMIKTLGLNIVVEGVETREQFMFLRDINCNTAQGYLISKPLNSADLMNRLKQYQKSRKWFTS